MKTCYRTTIAKAWPIELRQQAPNKFSVVYGLQDKTNLSYSQAAKELGACIMHALACESRLDNSEAA